MRLPVGGLLIRLLVSGCFNFGLGRGIAKLPLELVPGLLEFPHHEVVLSEHVMRSRILWLGSQHTLEGLDAFGELSEMKLGDREVN